jgi:hypothetical protein
LFIFHERENQVNQLVPDIINHEPAIFTFRHPSLIIIPRARVMPDDASCRLRQQDLDPLVSQMTNAGSRSNRSPGLLPEGGHAGITRELSTGLKAGKFARRHQHGNGVD